MVVHSKQGIATLTLQNSQSIASGDALHRALLDVLEQGHRAVIIDLRTIERIDAAGLGQLVRAYTTVRDRAGELKVVVGPATPIRELLDRTRLTTVLPTYVSTADAHASFSESLTC
ncbi:MAG TPA: STAS domain-containing protein [Vicinamibacterales bacterium]|nr:STAS domain-containing protein [Vicinamibacterales bacterium]